MTTQKATARPWGVIDSLRDGAMPGIDLWIVDSNKGYLIAELSATTFFECIEEMTANAELIVKAVNSFDLMLEALNGIIASNELTEAKEYARKALRSLQTE